MERLTIETPNLDAAVSLSYRLEQAGSTPRLDRGNARLVVAITLDERLGRILGIVQTWLDDEEIPSARLRLLDREFVLPAQAPRPRSRCHQEPTLSSGPTSGSSTIDRSATADAAKLCPPTVTTAQSSHAQAAASP